MHVMRANLLPHGFICTWADALCPEIRPAPAFPVCSSTFSPASLLETLLLYDKVNSFVTEPLGLSRVWCTISLVPIDFPNNLIDVDTSASLMDKEQSFCSLMFVTHRKPVFLLFCSLFFSLTNQTAPLLSTKLQASPLFSPLLGSISQKV